MERLREFRPELRRRFPEHGFKLGHVEECLRKICMHLERINIFSFQQQKQLRAGWKATSRPFDQAILDCYVQSSHLKTERAEQEVISRCVP